MNEHPDKIVVDVKHLDDYSATQLTKGRVIVAGEEMQVVLEHPDGDDLDIKIEKSGLTREKYSAEEQ